MLAVVAPSYSDPTGYELTEVPAPTVTDRNDVIIKVHAASINPVDVKIAKGVFKAVGLAEILPIRIGYDAAGTVAEIGQDVTTVKVGESVWTRLPEASKGSWAEIIKCPASHVSRMPSNLSFIDAASLPLAALTAMQALKKYEGSLEGKTIFVPAGLGGTGAFACQLAKNVFKAGKVITTVSTKKVEMVGKALGERVVDQIIDYTKEDPMKVIPRGSVDFILDTMGQAMDFLSLMTPATGTIISISTTPSGTTLQSSSFFNRPSKPSIPWYVRGFLDGADYVRKLRAMRWGVKYEYMFLQSNAEALDELGSVVEKNELRPVVGLVVTLTDIDKVKKACIQVLDGKGGVGKTVFEVIKD